MSVSDAMQIRIAELRNKSRAGTLTRDEMRDAIIFLRAERVAVPVAVKKVSAKKAAEAIDGMSLLDELKGL